MPTITSFAPSAALQQFYQMLPTLRYNDIVSTIDLDAIDTRLGAACRYIQEVSDVMIEQRRHEWLQSAVAHWLQPAPWVYSDSLRSFYIRRFHTVLSPYYPDRCAVQANHHYVMTFEDAVAGQIELASRSLSEILMLPFTWVEHHFPGAPSRIRIARELDLGPADMAQYAFYGAHQEHILSLPELR